MAKADSGGVTYSDPFGLCPIPLLCEAVDAAFVAADIKDIRDNGLTLGRGLTLALDVGGLALPFIPAVAGVVSRGGRAAAHSDDWAKLSGMLQDAARGKGNFSIGSATSSQADALGRAWVGEGFDVASDGRTLVSSDGLRQYRPGTYKPGQGKVQANLEWRQEGRGQWQGNAHIDIENQ